MEPKTNPEPQQPAPIMDVAPPPKADAPVEEPNQPVETAPAAPAQQPVQAAPAKPTPAKPKTSSTPVLAITLAIIFFIALAALAYYAYTKSN